MELVRTSRNFRKPSYIDSARDAAGILTILLQCPQEMIEPYLPLIISSITSLLTLTTLYTGHLPSSLPTRKRTEPLVQICHGNPGLLLLLATFRATYPSEWRAEWDEMERTASDRLWEEGLVKKGLGVCHGVSGNAWPWLLLAEVDRKCVFPSPRFPLSELRIPFKTSVERTRISLSTAYVEPNHTYPAR